MAAEYIVSRGNRNVILCERGIRTFETLTRNTLDLGVLPLLRSITHLPIIVDPSHGTGVAKAVTPLARAAAATGVDGVMVEVHPDPAKALSDGPQALTFPMFEEMMRDVRRIAEVMGQSVG
jgi:3-deoxy-7-phosphoheptulonate synthase